MAGQGGCRCGWQQVDGLPKRHNPQWVDAGGRRQMALQRVFFAEFNAQEGLRQAAVGGLREVYGGKRADVAWNGESSGLHCLKYRVVARLSGNLTLHQPTSVST